MKTWASVFTRGSCSSPPISGRCLSPPVARVGFSPVPAVTRPSPCQVILSIISLHLLVSSSALCFPVLGLRLPIVLSDALFLYFSTCRIPLVCQLRTLTRRSLFWYVSVVCLFFTFWIGWTNLICKIRLNGWWLWYLLGCCSLQKMYRWTNCEVGCIE